MEDDVKIDYEELMAHYDFSLGLWCIELNPNDVDIDWIREHAFKLTPCLSDKRPLCVG